MRRAFVSTLVAGGMLMAGSGAWAQTGPASAAWIHVRVEEAKNASTPGFEDTALTCEALGL